MPGLIALLGSGEYLDGMDSVDRRLLATASQVPPRVACLPTAAGGEGPASIRRWSDLGEQHFRRLGAHVESLAVVDRQTADDDGNADRIRAADLIYFSGGDPGYLYRAFGDA